jgi:hypothetical protein
VEKIDTIPEDPGLCLFLDTESQACMQAAETFLKLLPDLVVHR